MDGTDEVLAILQEGQTTQVGTVAFLRVVETGDVPV